MFNKIVNTQSSQNMFKVAIVTMFLNCDLNVIFVFNVTESSV